MKTYCKKISVFFLLILLALAGCNEEDEILVPTPQNELVAVAGADRNVTVQDVILLDGSGSFDKNNKPFTYLWSVKTKPQGSVAVLDSVHTVKTTFTPDVAGVYVIQLMIAQANWSSLDELVLTVTTTEPNGPTTVRLQEDITVNTTLADIIEDPTQPDYIVTRDIDVRADLIIAPGVVVAFEENTGLQIVTGSIRAIGNSNQGIVFRGVGDRQAYWKGIVIYSNSDINEFEFVTIKQGGSSMFAESGNKANVTLAGTQISGAALKVSNSMFSESGGYGLYVQSMSYLNYFSKNAFFNNASAAAYVPASQLHKIDEDSFSGNNGFDGVETGGPVLAESEMIWKKRMHGSYRVTSDILIRAGITIEPGITFQISPGRTIQVTDNGYLRATGTEASPIVFTASAPGVYWNGLFFNSTNQNNTLKYCVIEYAGQNRIADADHVSNIVVGYRGTVTIENSVIKNGLGYGVVTKDTDHVNHNIADVNSFANLVQGRVFPLILNYPDRPSLTGAWVDLWTLRQGVTAPADNFYNPETQTWFAGASNPWAMSSAGFGIRFNEDGSFVWTVAEHSPMTGCESFSAEYMTGTTSFSTDLITFNQDYWRSKFINACDETQNVDTEVTPSVIPLPYQIDKMVDAFTGETYWQLKFTNPDNSTFYYYRK